MLVSRFRSDAELPQVCCWNVGVVGVMDCHWICLLLFQLIVTTCGGGDVFVEV